MPPPHDAGMFVEMQVFDKAECFSVIDTKPLYQQVLIEEEHVEKTAFRTHLGVYDHLTLPFGLGSAGATLFMALQNIIKDLQFRCLLLYTDDLIVFSENSRQHQQHLNVLFDRSSRRCAFTLASDTCCPFLTCAGFFRTVLKRLVHTGSV
jgi:hypothetical protein